MTCFAILDPIILIAYFHLPEPLCETLYSVAESLAFNCRSQYPRLVDEMNPNPNVQFAPTSITPCYLESSLRNVV
jgi:hypothetical protein